mmetsp:Transcript_27263/g.84691  ORF Transcript_27263/g.84691 Transcript_27263/m.84691 type:complete len:301 (-) Transcript_27263:223-1125(-)
MVAARLRVPARTVAMILALPRSSPSTLAATPESRKTAMTTASTVPKSWAMGSTMTAPSGQPPRSRRPIACKALWPKRTRPCNNARSRVHCSWAIWVAAVAAPCLTDTSKTLNTSLNSVHAVAAASSAPGTDGWSWGAVPRTPLETGALASQVRRQMESMAALATSSRGWTTSGQSNAHSVLTWPPKAGWSPTRRAQQPSANASCTSKAFGWASTATRNCGASFRKRVSRSCLSSLSPWLVTAPIKAQRLRAAAATTMGDPAASALESPAYTLSPARRGTLEEHTSELSAASSVRLPTIMR